MNEQIRYRCLIRVWRNNPEFKKSGLALGNWLATYRLVVAQRFARPAERAEKFAPLLPRQEAVRQEILAAEQAAERDMGMRHAGIRYVSPANPRREVRYG